MKSFISSVVSGTHPTLSAAFAPLASGTYREINLWDAKLRRFTGWGLPGVYLVYITDEAYEVEIKKRLIINNSYWIKTYCDIAGKTVSGPIRKLTPSNGYFSTVSDLFDILAGTSHKHPTLDELEDLVQSCIVRHAYDLIRIGRTSSGNRVSSGYLAGSDPTTKSLRLAPEEYYRRIAMRFYPRSDLSLESTMLRRYKEVLGDPPLWNRM